MTRPDPPQKPGDFPSSVLEVAELGALFEAHGRRLVDIVRRRLDGALGSRLDPEDVVGAAFLDARRRWPAYAADRKVSEFVWLYRIVCDRLVEAWREATRQKRDVRRVAAYPDRPSVELALQLVAPDTTPTQAAVREEHATIMRRALALLREADREVILLRTSDDLSFREIGELLGAGENTVTVRYLRAIKKLKELWVRLTGEGRP